MATKHDDECLKKAADDEPIFVLRAKDRIAPDVVETWAMMAAAVLGVDHPKVREAKEHAQRMKDWGRKNGAKSPD